MNSSLRFVVLLVLLLAGGIVVNAWQYLGEAKVTRKELKDFPSELSAWKQSGSDQILDKETLSVLRASDYLSRNYHAADGQLANFYVGYYATQRDGAADRIEHRRQPARSDVVRGRDPEGGGRKA